MGGASDNSVDWGFSDYGSGGASSYEGGGSEVAYNSLSSRGGGTIAQQKNSTWDPVTNERIGGLHSDVQGNATNFVNDVESELGIQLRVTQGTRTNTEQNALYAQGRTASGRIVTNAKDGESYHNYGLAIDVVEIRGGQAVWNTNWQGIGNIGIRNGFEWGGNWTAPDRPHFQRTFGLSIGDLQGRARP